MRIPGLQSNTYRHFKGGGYISGPMAGGLAQPVSNDDEDDDDDTDPRPLADDDERTQQPTR